MGFPQIKVHFYFFCVVQGIHCTNLPRHIHQAEHCSIGWFENSTTLWQVGIETAEGEGEEEGYGDEF